MFCKIENRSDTQHKTLIIKLLPAITPFNVKTRFNSKIFSGILTFWIYSLV